MKLLLILAVVALLVWLVRGDRRKAVRQTGAQGHMPGPQPMVACAACGLHLPAPEAFVDAAGRPFCCAEHRRGAR